jgi:hypothetical protein
VGGVVLIAALLGAAAATAARNKDRPTGCQVRAAAIAGIARSHVLAVQGQTVVYRVRGSNSDVWWACRHGGTTRTKLGSTDRYQLAGSEYGPTHTLGALQLAGSWVLAIKTTGLSDYATCSKYAGYPCPEPSKTVVVLDVGGARPGPSAITHFSTGTATAEGLGPYTNLTRVLLSSAGGLAWLETTHAGTASAPAPVLNLYGCALTDAASGPACTPVQLDTSPAINPASVELRATTLTWNGNGQTKSASLS